MDSRCAEAERLALAAVAHTQRLRDIRTQLNEALALREADSRVRDRRQLTVAKDDARSAYSDSIFHARNERDVREAARVWLREIDRLNRQVASAERRAVEVGRRAADLERALPGIELAADAARIAAEAAQAACVDARNALADCEEDAGRRMHETVPEPLTLSARPSAAASTAQRPAPEPTHAPRPAAAVSAPQRAAARPSTRSTGVLPISLVLRGDRQTLLTLALRLGEETGVDAGRLQLLLLELREQIATRALEESFVSFPEQHPFWSQLPSSDSRQVVGSLSAMGFRFDGRGAWIDDHIPTNRELALAISHVGIDPRSMRRPPDQTAVDELWHGATVAIEEFLGTKAPDLDLQQVMDCLGPRAARLAELWDLWGRMRPVLLTPASAAGPA